MQDTCHTSISIIDFKAPKIPGQVDETEYNLVIFSKASEPKPREEASLHLSLHSQFDNSNQGPIIHYQTNNSTINIDIDIDVIVKQRKTFITLNLSRSKICFKKVSKVIVHQGCYIKNLQVYNVLLYPTTFYYFDKELKETILDQIKSDKNTQASKIHDLSLVDATSNPLERENAFKFKGNQYFFHKNIEKRDIYYYSVILNNNLFGSDCETFVKPTKVLDEEKQLSCNQNTRKDNILQQNRHYQQDNSFIYSLIKAWSNVTQLSEYFTKTKYIEQNDKKERLLNLLEKVLIKAELPFHAMKEDQNFKKLNFYLNKSTNRSIQNPQQDAIEFYRTFLKDLDDELETILKNPDLEGSNEVNKETNPFSEPFTRTEGNVVKKLFSSQLFKEVICDNCQKKNYSFNNLWDFSISITSEKALYLEKSSKNLFQKNWIAYEPECHCKESKKSSERESVFGLSKVLTISFKRHEESKGEVIFPTCLKMEEFLGNTRINFTAGTSIKNLKYILFGIIDYKQDHFEFNLMDHNQWNMRDLEAAKSTDLKSRTCYMLFYKLKENQTDWEQKQVVLEVQRPNLDIDMLDPFKNKSVKSSNKLEDKGDDEKHILNQNNMIIERTSENQIGNKLQSTIFKSKKLIQELIKKNMGYEGFRSTGLPNLRNSCYINSVLQCLINNPLLTSFFFQKHHLKECKEQCLATTFYSILNIMNDKTKDHDSLSFRALNELLRQLKSDVGQINPIFNDDEQRDGFEFLMSFLEGLNNDLNRVKEKPKYKQIIDKGKDYSLQEKSDEHFENMLAWENSIVTDLFCGQIANIIRCTDCREEKTSFDPFWTISISFKKKRWQPPTLEQLIEDFQEEEILKDESLICNSCKKAGNLTSKSIIWRLPEVLIITFKIFEKKYGTYTKIDQELTYPVKKLSMKSFLEEQSFSTFLCKFILLAVSAEDSDYTLYAILNHSGTLQRGHYTADCLNVYDKEWYHYDDWHSRDSSINMEQKTTKSRPYILFYIRSSRLEALKKEGSENQENLI